MNKPKWSGLKLGDNVRYLFTSGTIISLSTDDPNKARIKTDKNDRFDVVCEYCVKLN